MRKPIAACVLLLVAPAAMAEDVSYTWAELNYTTSGARDGIFSNGFSIGGSVGLPGPLFAFGSLHAIDSDRRSGVITTATTLGLGLHWPLAGSLDLSAALSSNLRVRFEEEDPFSETGTGSARHDGVGVHAGVRMRPTSLLELNAGVKYADFGHGVHDTSVRAGGRLYLTPLFAMGAEVSHSDDGTLWTVALRYDFLGRN